MFREIEIDVVLGSPVEFRFPVPLSITSLLVANSSEEILWEFVAQEFRPVKIVGEAFDPSGNPDDGSIPAISANFQTWKVEEAPPEVLALLSLVQNREETRLQEQGPDRPPLPSVKYGELPPGYREKQPPRPLVPREYNVLIFAEQGDGAKRFTITGA